MKQEDVTVEKSQAHNSRIGNIFGWLQSIEFLLRWWLTKHAGRDVILPTYVGQVLDKTPLTDYRSLGALLADYNAQLTAAEMSSLLDPAIVEIRDSHAHGRPLALEADEHMTLYRFGIPADGKVETTAMKPLSPEVLEAELDLLREQWGRVHKCGMARGYFH
jgi:hypothetical protein